MPLTDPNNVQDAAAGQPLQAARLDADRDAIMYLGANHPRARVFNNANISVATNTATALTFNSERRDVGNCHSTVSNTSRLTVPAGEAGDYDSGGHIGFAASGTGGVRQAYIRVNGTLLIAVQGGPPSTTVGTERSVVTNYSLVAGDYLELIVFHDVGAALNVVTAGAYSPEFWCRWTAT